MTEDITAHDHRRRYCPMLGHEIHFGYCRSPGAPLPCRKIFDCWFRIFDIQSFVSRHFSQADIEKILAPRRDKTVSDGLCHKGVKRLA